MIQQNPPLEIAIAKGTFKFPFKIQKLDLSSFYFQEITYTLNQSQWSIVYGRYQLFKWKNIFQNMISCSAEEISFFGNQQKEIVKQIQDVVYVNLKRLFLNQNNINNIEAISLIDFQYLANLHLCSNNIGQIKCLSKLQSWSLNRLLLDCNPITQISFLSKYKVKDKQQLKSLAISNYQNQIGQDLSIIVKSNYQYVESLYIGSQNRIKQPKVNDMIALRYIKLEIINQ